MYVSWEPEGCYCISKMFRWEPEGSYCHWLCTAIAPFWFSTEHLWAAITPFWLSTDDVWSIHNSCTFFTYNFYMSKTCMHAKSLCILDLICVFRPNLCILDLITVYRSYIRPICEYGCPVWHGGLTVKQSSSLESVQKRALRIILGNQFSSYDDALNICNLTSL